jgi:hydroxyacylglutathione hydrolase
MFFRQYDLACLSLFSYLIGDLTTGQAVVVDPQRDISRYLADAAEHGLTIGRVIETHVHADFLSGHRELAAATGALISYGSRAKLGFDFEPLHDGQTLSLGEVTLEMRHTPGHTPEGISIVVRATADAAPTAVLTGDTLFIGDVGRPDLLAAAGMSASEMAQDLYRSLHGKLLTLPDATSVYPAHGAGSACGKHMSSATASTIGEQRATNYALQPMSIDAFVAVVTAGQPATPPYFAHAVHANRSGDQDLLDEHDVVPTLGIDAALNAVAHGAVMLDVRTPETFASGHLRDSINVGLAGRFAEYVGDVIAHGQPIVLVANEHDAHEARIRLARIGFDNVIGAITDIDSTLVTRPDQAAAARRLSAVEVASWASPGDGPANVQIVDVRSPSETEDGSVPGAINVPIAQLIARLGELEPSRPTVVYCAGGYRSSIAASTLRAHSFGPVADIIGGYGAWRALIRPS